MRFIILTAVLAVFGCTQASVPSASTQPSVSAFGISDLVRELRSSGLTVEGAGEIRQPFFSPKARVFRLNGSDLQVYEYADAAAAEREAATVAPEGGSIGTSMVAWLATPHFFRKDRVIAIYIGSDQQVVAHLGKIMGEQFAGR